MLSSLLRSALVLAAVCCLTYAESVITCEGRMQRLSCDHGVVSVLTVAYGRTDRQTCSEGKPSGQLANTACSQTGALEALATWCNGTKVCEVDKEIFGGDTCPDTYKYIQTTYTCLPARHVVACENKEAELSCDNGQTIALIGAFYGRADRITCTQDAPPGTSNKIDCFTRTANRVVAERCNGESSCSVSAVNSVFQDPCPGTFKYLEVAYTCECKQRFLQCGFSLLEFSLLAY
ncbi:L-rhamnose-binding lectin CSL2-like [Gadus macrocephalus]|uniref:L-rhamnose-binding lectin CSL2-like n=1 Tax=Gadus macrocephalus TaxID=80720 RepID=UPI0028CB2752|nr:L-rhamnose-binding lectin CSL2-like [Gadus macrocephalus]